MGRRPYVEFEPPCTEDDAKLHRFYGILGHINSFLLILEVVNTS